MRSPLRSSAIGPPRAASGATCPAISPRVAPEAARGGPIALLRNGDRITFDVPARRLDVQLSAAELRRRRARWHPPTPPYAGGVMGKYARLVSSASEGAVTVLLDTPRQRSVLR